MASTWFLLCSAEQGNLKEEGWVELHKRIKDVWSKALKLDYEADFEMLAERLDDIEQGNLKKNRCKGK